MSEITMMWAQLSKDERACLESLALADDGMTLPWSDMTRRLIRVGLINKVSRGVDYTFRASLTPAGRALLPAGEAGNLNEHLVKQLGYWQEMKQAPLDTLEKLRVAQADLAAALARAQAAEGEVQRLRAALQPFADIWHTYQSEGSWSARIHDDGFMGEFEDYFTGAVDWDSVTDVYEKASEALKNK